MGRILRRSILGSSWRCRTRRGSPVGSPGAATQATSTIYSFCRKAKQSPGVELQWRSSTGLEHDRRGGDFFMQRRSESRAASAKLVYIGGYGRSGSTLLEYLLAAHPEVVACGEIERHLRVFTRRRTCTCGEPARHCQVWGEFQHKSGRLEGLDHTQLSLQVLDHISRQYAVMVDS